MKSPAFIEVEEYLEYAKSRPDLASRCMTGIMLNMPLLKPEEQKMARTIVRKFLKLNA